MSTIAVIIPTHNRPELLHEAIQSVQSQTRKADQIIVVDDGSEQPVIERDLKKKYGDHLSVLRNDQARGLAWARNQGVEATTTDYIAHLDDDDLYSPETIEESMQYLESSHKPDLVFLGACGFGTRAEYFNRVGNESVKKIIQHTQHQTIDVGITVFNNGLFLPLLKSVPLTFQHAVTSKEIWIKASQLRRKAYALDPKIGSEEEAKNHITGTLRDSEWALYASSISQNSILINKPRYLVRCEGQGYSSVPGNAEKHVLQQLKFKETLQNASLRISELSIWKASIKQNLEEEYFSASYQYLKNKNRWSSWKYLTKAAQIQFRLKYLKFAVRTLLPA